MALSQDSNPNHSVAGLAAAVVVGPGGVGQAIATALRAAGANVATIGTAGEATNRPDHEESRLDTRAAADTAFARIVGKLGRLEALIYAAGLPTASAVTAIGEHTDESWHTTAEQPVKSALFALQAAFSSLSLSQGRVVFVLPTLSMSGAPGLTAMTTAIEGQRLLMKVTARQWAQHGVRVNCVGISTELALPQLMEPKALSTLRRVAYMGAGDLGPSFGPEARTDVDRDLIPLVSFLAGRSSVHMTGQTIVADGGAWMVP